MAEGTIQKNGELLSRKLERLLFAVVGLLLVFAVLAQPELSLLAGFLQIQISETGLITDPMATGGVGAALLNAAMVLLLSTLLIRWMKLPFTGMTLACLFLMAGFALLGKNLVNIAPIVVGGWLHALYRREKFAKYVYLTLYGTCLSPMVSFLMVRARPGFRWVAMPSPALPPESTRATTSTTWALPQASWDWAWPVSSRALGWSSPPWGAGARRATGCCAR